MLSVYDVNLYMFRAYLGSSSGGTTVCIQQLVLIILFRRLSAVLVGLELQVQYNQDSCANCCIHTVIEASWNVMAHAKKPDFVFRRNGRVHLNRRGRQFSRLLAAEVCLSAVVMLDTPCSEVVWRLLAIHSAISPFISPPVRHRVPSHFNWNLHKSILAIFKAPTKLPPGSTVGALYHKL